jgi:hypothetical protein
MNDQKQPYLKLTKIKEVVGTEEANNLIRDGWVYLGFCSRTMTTNLGTTPDQDYQVPTHYLGEPDPDQDL